MSTAPNSVHESVLLHEVVEGLLPSVSHKAQGSSGLIYLDGTLGGAGHTLAFIKANKNSTLTVIGLDQDPQAIFRAEKNLRGKAEKVILECENFRNLDKVLLNHKIDKVSCLLLDLGLSSDELETSGRGFTFQKDEPLLMTMGDPTKYQFTAKDIVNSWEEETLADIIFGYGEDRFARRIAKAIVTYRAKKKIETTGELAEIVKTAYPFIGRSKIHPATKTFQALRIAVNDELNALKDGLAKGYEHLAPKGRMAVISFHSLEDRIVKDFFRSKAGTTKAEMAVSGANLITKKPITAGLQEIAENPRSRSAKLRIIEKK